MAQEQTPQANSYAARCSKPIPWTTAILLFWPVAVFGATLDLWSKAAVFNWLPTLQPYSYVIFDGQTVPEYRYVLIDGFLQLIMRENQGAAFSIFHGWTFFLVAISCVAFVIVVGIFFSRKVTHKLVLLAMGCITGGIAGNLYDRMFNEGRVRDFIDVYAGDHHFPTFNVADSMLCIGVGLLILVNLTCGQKTDAPDTNA